MQPIFITGIGTDVGKTLVAAILTEALQADYWKPVQAGFADGTDSEWIKETISNAHTKIHPEAYRLRLPASPHIAAREEGIKIDLDEIEEKYKTIQNKSTNRFLVIEGAGGLLVPLNENEFVIDLIKKLKAKLIIVSRNYLGSINHSLMTAKLCQHNHIPVIGWIFNDQYLNYEHEIANWTDMPVIASIPFIKNPNKQSIAGHAKNISSSIVRVIAGQP